MARRVSPSERLRAQMDELLGSESELASILEDVARLSVRLMMQTAIEAEVDESWAVSATSVGATMTVPVAATAGSRRRRARRR